MLRSRKPDRNGGESLPLKLVLWVCLALGVSFLCSLLEATLLASRQATLVELKRSGSRGAGLLLALKRKRVDDAISAILILNTGANTLGATLAGAEAARLFGSRWIGLFSGVLTFLILVFSEIIPKTLGATYAARLSGFVGWTLEFMTRGLAPVLRVSRSLTRLLTRGGRTTISRGELTAMVDSAANDGTISDADSRILTNLLQVNDVQVEDVMTPRTVAFMLEAATDVASLLASREARGFSRIPLFRDAPDEIVGYVLVRDVLLAVAQGCDRSLPLETFVREVTFIPELARVGTALKQLLKRREAIAIATDEHGGLAGLVTREDLTETLLGVEIMDESDRVPDLREAAARLRQQRMERLRAARKLHTDEPESL